MIYFFSSGVMIAILILVVSLPVFFVFLLMREVKDNSPRKGLRSPKITIPVGAFLLYLSGVILNPSMLFNPFSLAWNLLFVLGFCFVLIGVIALYKNHKYGVV